VKQRESLRPILRSVLVVLWVEDKHYRRAAQHLVLVWRHHARRDRLTGCGQRLAGYLSATAPAMGCWTPAVTSHPTMTQNASQVPARECALSPLITMSDEAAADDPARTS
jgi:hypothetical protein